MTCTWVPACSASLKGSHANRECRCACLARSMHGNSPHSLAHCPGHYGCLALRLLAPMNVTFSPSNDTKTASIACRPKQMPSAPIAQSCQSAGPYASLHMVVKLYIDAHIFSPS